MATTATTAAVEETAKTPVVLTNRTIVRVTKGEKNRYYFELDGDSFEGFNANGEAIMTNSFSKDLTTLCKEIGVQHELLNTVFAMASVSKGILNPTIVSLCLTGSTISVERQFKLATDERETGIEGDTYGKDTWKTLVTKVTPKVSAMAQQLILQLAMNPNTLTIVEKAEKPNIADLMAAIAG